VHITNATKTNLAAPINPMAPIEIGFDRLLSPACITRQTFALTDKRNNTLEHSPTYDPVARVVTLHLFGTLQDGEFYQLRIVTPPTSDPSTGLRAIDGAALDPGEMNVISFKASASAPLPAPPPPVDYCRDIAPIFASKCGTIGVCHGGTEAAAGLRLDTNAGILSTAVGRVAEGANTGPHSTTGDPGVHFGVDMPIIDPGITSTGSGNAGNSWLVYKLLMAYPAAMSTTVSAEACDAGADGGGGNATPVDLSTLHGIAWQPLSDGERATLADLVPGREMPFPGDPGKPASSAQGTLTIAELERVSQWITQTKATTPLVPSSCPMCIP
jgi:hypothetical protein